MKYNVDERWCFILKKFICGLLVGLILMMGVTVSAVPEIKSAVFSPDIKLVVNGKTLDTQIVSVVKTGEVNMTNYVSARALAESLGATVTWDGKERVINVSTNDKTINSISTTTSAPVQAKDPFTIQTDESESKYKIPFPVHIVDDTGLAVYNIHNGYLYGLFTIDVQNAIKLKGYVMNNAADYKSLQIVKDGEGILVRNIETHYIGDYTYISYDFYLEHIKPLLK